MVLSHFPEGWAMTVVINGCFSKWVMFVSCLAFVKLLNSVTRDSSDADWNDMLYLS